MLISHVHYTPPVHSPVLLFAWLQHSTAAKLLFVGPNNETVATTQVECETCNFLMQAYPNWKVSDFIQPPSPADRKSVV